MKQAWTALAIALSLLALTGDARADDADADEARAATARGTVFHGVVLGGASMSTVFGLDAAAGHIGAGLVTGDDHALVRATFGLDADLGSTFGGLPLKDFSLSAGVLFVLGPVRLGLGPELTYMRLSRAPSSSLPALVGLGIGLVGWASADLWSFDHDHDRALFLALRPEASWLHNAHDPLTWTHDASLVSAALLVGVRF